MGRTMKDYVECPPASVSCYPGSAPVPAGYEKEVARARGNTILPRQGMVSTP